MSSAHARRNFSLLQLGNVSDESQEEENHGMGIVFKRTAACSSTHCLVVEMCPTRGAWGSAESGPKFEFNLKMDVHIYYTSTTL